HPPSTQYFINTCQAILNQPLGRLFVRSFYANWHWLAINEQTNTRELEYFLTAFGHGPYPGCSLPTLFYSACSVRNLPIVQFLLEYEDGKLLDEYIQEDTGSRREKLLQLLIYATIEDFLPATKYLLSLDNSLASMVFGHWHTTPLMLACYCKAQNTVQYLCSMTSACVVDSTGCSALHYAIAGRNLCIVQYLIEHAGMVVRETVDELRERDEGLCLRPPVTCVQYALCNIKVGEQRSIKASILSYVSKKKGS
ncbi:hypothetical protein EON65_43500, partial [archaeon]